MTVSLETTRLILDEDGQPLLNLVYAADTELLTVDWLQDLTPALVQKAGIGTMEFLAQWPVRWIFSDGHKINADWIDLLPWVQYELMPFLTAAGLKAICYWINDDPRNRLDLTIQKHTLTPIITMAILTDETQARAWLAQQMSAAKPD